MFTRLRTRTIQRFLLARKLHQHPQDRCQPRPDHYRTVAGGSGQGRDAPCVRQPVVYSAGSASLHGCHYHQRGQVADLAACPGGASTLRPVLQFLYAGFFFNNFLPANVGGDVMRGYGLARYTDRTADAAVRGGGSHRRPDGVYEHGGRRGHRGCQPHRPRRPGAGGVGRGCGPRVGSGVRLLLSRRVRGSSRVYLPGACWRRWRPSGKASPMRQRLSLQVRPVGACLRGCTGRYLTLIPSSLLPIAVHGRWYVSAFYLPLQSSHRVRADGAHFDWRARREPGGVPLLLRAGRCFRATCSPCHC